MTRTVGSFARSSFLAVRCFIAFVGAVATASAIVERGGLGGSLLHPASHLDGDTVVAFVRSVNHVEINKTQPRSVFHFLCRVLNARYIVDSILLFYNNANNSLVGQWMDFVFRYNDCWVIILYFFPSFSMNVLPTSHWNQSSAYDPSVI